MFPVSILRHNVYDGVLEYWVVVREKGTCEEALQQSSTQRTRMKAPGCSLCTSKGSHTELHPCRQMKSSWSPGSLTRRRPSKLGRRRSRIPRRRCSLPGRPVGDWVSFHALGSWPALLHKPLCLVPSHSCLFGSKWASWTASWTRSSPNAPS